MDCERALREQGVRLTPQRRLILNVIEQCHGHITAEEIAARVQAISPDVDASTVYRNLRRLLDLRLIAVTDLGGGRMCYEILCAVPHHHLVCHRCGAVMELDDRLVAGLREAIWQTYSFLPQIDHLAIWGICRNCQGHQNGHDAHVLQGG